MSNVICFNVGGEHYEVSHSLLQLYPNCLLSESASEQMLLNPEVAVALDRDGSRFRIVLEYLCNDGHVILPMTVSKPSFLADLACYGIKNVDTSKIASHFGSDPQDLAQTEKEISSKISDVLRGWKAHRSIVYLARECASRYLLSGGKLQISIHGPTNQFPKKEGTVWCSRDVWFSLLWLFCNGGKSIGHSAQVECNQYLAKVGLKVDTVRIYSKEYAIQVSMKQTNI